MAFNREKTQRTAEKLAQKGRLEASIKEYKKILAKGGDDAAIHNTVGDLYRRANKNRDAISHWIKTSELFEKKGFYVKAIAVQKKIQKLEPSSLQVRRKLGELYLQQGLTKEARDEFQSLIEHYLRQNDAASAINVYQRLIQVEPEEPSHRAKLADLYVKSGIPQKAVREYGHIAKMMADGGAPDQAIKILMRALEMDASDAEFVRRAVIALRDAGAPHLAINFLDAAAERNAEAESFRSLVPEAAAFEQPEPEEPVLDTVAPPAAAEPEPSTAQEEPSQETAPGAEAQEAEEEWIPVDTDEGAAVDTVEAREAPESEEAATGEEMAAAADDELEVEITEEESPALVQPPADMAEEERGTAFGEGVGQDEFVLDVDGDLGLEAPGIESVGAESVGAESASAPSEVEELEEGPEAVEEEVELRLDDLPLDELDVETPAEVAAESESTGAPIGDESRAFDEPEAATEGLEEEIELVAQDVESPSEQVEEAPAEMSRPDDEGGLRLDDFDFEDIEIQIPEEPSPSTRVEPPPSQPLASSEVHPPSEESAAPTVSEPPSEEPAAWSEAQPPSEEPVWSVEVPGAESEPSTEVPPPSEPAETPGEEPRVAVGTEASGEHEAPPASPPQETPLSEPQPPPEKPQPPPVEAPPSMAAVPSLDSGGNGAPTSEPTVRVDDLLAEAEVFVKYGLHEKAVERLEKVLELDPSHLGAATQLVRLQLEREEHERVGPLVNDLYREVSETGAMELWRELKDELAAVGYRFDGESVVGLPDGRSLAAAPVEPVGPDQSEAVDLMAMGSEIDTEIRTEADAAAASGSAIDWLDDTSEGSDGERLFEEEEELFDLGAALQDELGPEEGVPPAGPEEQSLEEIIEGFKKGVSENLSPEDSDTHYNLGIAYREMMLLDEAISEFQIAAKDPRYLVDCCAMLGLCFREKGLPDLALKWYRKGLESESIDEEQTLGMMYEMGTAYLELEDPQSAYRTFVDIYGQNTNYRDVADRVQELGHSAN